jgi:hypothetical protein
MLIVTINRIKPDQIEIYVSLQKTKPTSLDLEAPFIATKNYEEIKTELNAMKI